MRIRNSASFACLHQGLTRRREARRYERPIGSILLDAMDRGLPVIASRVGGVPDIVHDEENGILIDAGRVDQLRAAILKLRDEPERRRALGESGRAFARAFSADAMADKYVDIYCTVLGWTF